MLKQRTSPKAAQSQLCAQGVPELLARLLAARGVQDRSEWVGNKSHLPDPYLLKGMSDAVALLVDAIDTQRRVLVVSDYDCDGATSCAVMVRALRAFGANVDFQVPNRLVHGYGLSDAIVQQISELDPKPSLLLTVDNGISSVSGVALAKQLGMDVLVTDHHLAPPVLPQAAAIVNPNQPGCTFPTKNIAGVGVAWFTMLALEQRLKELGRKPVESGFTAESLLPLVATGTVADVVQLDFINRTLVDIGLGMIRRNQCPVGLATLMAVAGANRSFLTCQDIGFQIGPRINAAGRIDDMRIGIECLTTDSHARASALSRQLNTLNVERKDIQQGVQDDALTQLLVNIPAESYTVAVKGDSWHEGVVGIVAGRIKELTHKPSFVLTLAEDGSIKGSGRSIPGFHLKHALDHISIEHPGLLVKYGGHAMAAGVTVSDVDLFIRVFEETVAREMDPLVRERVIEHDGELGLEHLTLDQVEQLELAVWGQGFPAPQFCQRLPIVEIEGMGQDEVKHTRLWLDAGEDERIAGVLWRVCPDDLDSSTPLLWQPSVNEHRGKRSVQVRAELIPG